ncbi:MAG: acyltransferase [Bacteroidaceae bacterium]|nr:acyltransferase [Bacteroidaceae bacterium]
MSDCKQRIEFIDLAKGICILLIIIGHSGVQVDYPGLTAMRTPLYLTLSGLFFKDYGGLFNLFIRKCNKILIPFLFFYLSSYALFYLFNAIYPGLIVSEAKGIMDVFTQTQYFNGPLWFLLVIFWDNIIFGIIHLNIKSEWSRAFLVLAIGCCGLLFYKHNLLVACSIDAAFTCLPFFYFGYLLKRSDILVPYKLDYLNILFAAILFFAAYIIDTYSHPTLFFHDRIISGNIFAVVFLPLTSVMGLLLLCKAIGYLPVVSYFGRYSIIPLCTHHLIYRPIQLVIARFVPLDDGGAYIVAAATVFICLACIPLFVRFLPYVTAQKDTIRV